MRSVGFTEPTPIQACDKLWTFMRHLSYILLQTLNIFYFFFISLQRICKMFCFVVTFEIGRVPGTGMAHPLLWTGPHRRCKDESLQFPIWSNWKQIILNGQWQKRSLICMKKDWIRKNSGFPVALFTPQPRESGWQNWTHCRLFKAVQERTRSTVLQLNCQGFARLLKEGLRSRQRHGNTCDCFDDAKNAMPSVVKDDRKGRKGLLEWTWKDFVARMGSGSGPGDDSSLPALSLGLSGPDRLDSHWLRRYTRMYEIADIAMPSGADAKTSSWTGCVLTRGQTTSQFKRSFGASPQKGMHLSTTGRSNSMWQCHKYAVEQRRCVHIGFLRHPTFATS